MEDGRTARDDKRGVGWLSKRTKIRVDLNIFDPSGGFLVSYKKNTLDVK